MDSYSSTVNFPSHNLFARSDKAPSNFTCAHPKPNQHGAVLAIGISFKDLMAYIATACLTLTAISTLILTSKHLRQYTVPKEQRQIIRIIFVPLFFAIISIISIIYEEKSIYLKPIMQVYEAFCVAALFFLFLEYVCSEESKRIAYFTAVENKDKKGNVIPGGSLLWYNRTWVAILQFPVMKTILSVIEISTQAANVYCTNSLSPKYAHIWVLIIDIFIIGGALTAIFRFYGRLKLEFDPKHRALVKLVSFKGMVVVQFFLDIIFGFLNGKTFKPSERFTYNDLYYGLPMMLTAIEALIFSLAFHWAFAVGAYQGEKDTGSRLSVWGAMLDAANWMDIFKNIFVAFVKKNPSGVRDLQAGHRSFEASRRQSMAVQNARGNGPLGMWQSRFGAPIGTQDSYQGGHETDERSTGRRSSVSSRGPRVEPRNIV